MDKLALSEICLRNKALVMWIMSFNLKKIRKDKGVRQDAIAELLGVSNAQVSRLENLVSQPSLAQIEKLAKFFNISEKDLIGEEGFSDQQSPRLPQLPIKGKVAAGVWAEPQEPSFRNDILALPAPDLEFQFGLEVSGDSLKDLNCLDGDILHCVSTQAMYPNQDDVVIAQSVRGDLYEYTAKKIHRKPDGSIELHAANDKYHPIKMDEMSNEQEIQIIGKVVRVFREMK